MSAPRYYYIWYLLGREGAGHWTTMNHPNRDPAPVNASDNPLALSLEEATRWYDQRFGSGFIGRQYEVREILDAETRADQARRRAHADKYL